MGTNPRALGTNPRAQNEGSDLAEEMGGLSHFDFQNFVNSFIKTYDYQSGPFYKPLIIKALKEAFKNNWTTPEQILEKVKEYNQWIIRANRKYKHKPENWISEGLYNQDFAQFGDAKVPEPIDPKKSINEQVEREYRERFGPPDQFKFGDEEGSLEHHRQWTARRAKELKEPARIHPEIEKKIIEKIEVA